MICAESHSIHPSFINHTFKMYQNYFKIQYFQMKEKEKKLTKLKTVTDPTGPS